MKRPLDYVACALLHTPTVSQLITNLALLSKDKERDQRKSQLGSDKNSFQVTDNNKINLGVHLKEDSEQTGFRERKKNLLFALMTKKITPATNGHA